MSVHTLRNKKPLRNKPQTHCKITQHQQYLTTKAVAIILGVQQPTVQSWCRDKIIQGVLKTPKGWMIPRTWVHPDQHTWTALKLPCK